MLILLTKTCAKSGLIFLLAKWLLASQIGKQEEVFHFLDLICDVAVT